jgi:hypothetical protein
LWRCVDWRERRRRRNTGLGMLLTFLFRRSHIPAFLLYFWLFGPSRARLVTARGRC